MSLLRRRARREPVDDSGEVIVEHGPSLAKGPALIAGTILVAFGLAALLKNNDFPSFSSSFPDGDVDGTNLLGIEVNGWTAFFSITAGALLLFGAAQRHLARMMSLIVGLALAACAVIAIVDGDVLGLAAANFWTKLGFAIAGGAMLLNALMPRVKRRREVAPRRPPPTGTAIGTASTTPRRARPPPLRPPRHDDDATDEPRTTVDRDPAHDDAPTTPHRRVSAISGSVPASWATIRSSASRSSVGSARRASGGRYSTSSACLAARFPAAVARTSFARRSVGCGSRAPAALLQVVHDHASRTARRSPGARPAAACERLARRRRSALTRVKLIPIASLTAGRRSRRRTSEDSSVQTRRASSSSGGGDALIAPPPARPAAAAGLLGGPGAHERRRRHARRRPPAPQAAMIHQPERAVSGSRGARRADDRHAQRLADLAAGRGDRGGHARLRRRHPATGGVGDRRVDHAEADPEDDVGGEQPPERVVASSPVSMSALIAIPARRQQRRARPAGPTIRPESGATTTVIAAIGSVSRPGVQRAVAAHVLQVQGVEEQEAAQAGERATAIERRPAERVLRKKRRSISGSGRRGS